MKPADTLSDFSAFQSLLDRPIEDKLRDFQREQRLKHLICAAQLRPDLLKRLSHLADMIRRMARQRESNLELRQLLSHKRAMLYFTQPSTRTFLSFMAACQILGITCNEVRDPKTSSEIKRESHMDSIRMFSSYFDVIIMRSPIANFAECCAYMMNRLESQEMRSVPTINAGSGSDEHPTQALLDFYTIQRSFAFDSESKDTGSKLDALRLSYPDLQRGPAGKTYLFCGDIGRGRTVRSLATVLSQYDSQRMIFVSPDHDALKMDDGLRSRLQDAGVSVYEYNSLDAELNGQPILSQADCFYMTRIQREHNSAADTEQLARMDLGPFQLTPDRVQRLKSFSPIMHPFPRDSVVQELPTEIDSDPRVMYFRQARNGMWVRAALLVHLLDASEELFMAYNRFYRD